MASDIAGYSEELKLGTGELVFLVSEFLYAATLFLCV